MSITPVFVEDQMPDDYKHGEVYILRGDIAAQKAKEQE
jgi:hypothetical protein